MEFGEVRPVAELPGPQRLEGALGQIAGAVGFMVARQGHVAREHLGQEAEITEALNVGMAAQGIDPAATEADIAQQQLDHGHDANVLHADRVMRPAQRVETGQHPVRRGGRGDQLTDLEKGFNRRAAQLMHLFRRIAIDVVLEQIEHAARMLKRVIHLRIALIVQFVGPSRPVVADFRIIGVVAAEQALVEAEILAHDERGIGIRLHIRPVDGVLFQQIADDAIQEGNVRAGPDRHVQVRHRRRAGEAGIDHDQLGLVARLRFHRPLEADRMRLRRVAAHGDDDVGMLDVHPGVGHRPAPETGRQRRHRRRVTDARLAVDHDHAQRPGDLVGEIAGLVGGRRSRQETRRHPTVDGLALVVFGDEIRISIILYPLRDLLHRPVPGHALPLAAARRPVFRGTQARLAMHERQ